MSYMSPLARLSVKLRCAAVELPVSPSGRRITEAEARFVARAISENGAAALPEHANYLYANLRGHSQFLEPAAKSYLNAFLQNSSVDPSKRF
ncbi:MAG: hypothetical protein IPJ65_27500 [Archangiaceae bacterium]|nr:hypothetical protein [Archangiaceae bacterium]